MDSIRASASVRFGTSGVPEMEVRLYLTDSTRMSCHRYGRAAPILSINDERVMVALSVPEPEKVTLHDVKVARELAEAVAGYVAELERLAGLTGEADPGMYRCAANNNGEHTASWYGNDGRCDACGMLGPEAVW
jgi:hypothetical protein